MKFIKNELIKSLNYKSIHMFIIYLEFHKILNHEFIIYQINGKSFLIFFFLTAYQRL